MSNFTFGVFFLRKNKEYFGGQLGGPYLSQCRPTLFPQNQGGLAGNQCFETGRAELCSAKSWWLEGMKEKEIFLRIHVFEYIRHGSSPEPRAC